MALTLRLSLIRAHAVIIARAVLYNICRSKSLVDVPSEIEIPNAEAVPVVKYVLIAEYFNEYYFN